MSSNSFAAEVRALAALALSQSRRRCALSSAGGTVEGVGGCGSSAWSALRLRAERRICLHSGEMGAQLDGAADDEAIGRFSEQRLAACRLGGSSTERFHTDSTPNFTLCHRGAQKLL